jgi:hypothetical protein
VIYQRRPAVVTTPALQELHDVAGVVLAVAVPELGIVGMSGGVEPAGRCHADVIGMGLVAVPTGREVERAGMARELLGVSLGAAQKERDAVVHARDHERHTARDQAGGSPPAEPVTQAHGVTVARAPCPVDGFLGLEPQAVGRRVQPCVEENQLQLIGGAFGDRVQFVLEDGTRDDPQSQCLGHRPGYLGMGYGNGRPEDP